VRRRVSTARASLDRSSGFVRFRHRSWAEVANARHYEVERRRARLFGDEAHRTLARRAGGSRSFFAFFRLLPEGALHSVDAAGVVHVRVPHLFQIRLRLAGAAAFLSENNHGRGLVRG
jgi:hypothetical protein